MIFEMVECEKFESDQSTSLKFLQQLKKHSFLDCVCDLYV